MAKDFTGISIANILLLECNIEWKGVQEKPSYNLALVQLQREAKKDMLVTAAFDLMHGVNAPACTMKCTFVAVYTKDENATIEWTDFSDTLAISHMIPFVREFVMNVTNRMPLPPLMIPPINVGELVKEFRDRETAITSLAPTVAPSA